MVFETKPDILATVKFYSTEKGGRNGPTRSDFFSCPFVFNNQYFDCRLLLKDIGKIYPGDTVKVPIKFLLSDVVQQLKVGDIFHLWEGGVKAEGKVDKIFL